MVEPIRNAQYQVHIHKDETIRGKSVERNMHNVYETKFQVGIVGVGNIGASVAHELLEAFPHVELNLYTLHQNQLRKKIYEIISPKTQTPEAILEAEKKKKRIRIYKNIRGETNEDCAGDKLESPKRFLDSDFIIISARNTQYQFSDFKRRDDEYVANKGLIKEIADCHKGFPKIVLVVSGPLELILEDFLEHSKLPPNRLLGQSYIDTLRFRRKLINKLFQTRGITVRESEISDAIVLGEHSKYPVPVYSSTKIKGRRVLDIINDPNFKDEVLKELTKTPAQIQFGEGTYKNTRDPYIATCKTIEALLTGEEIPASARDTENKLFITSVCRSKSETIDGKPSRVVERVTKKLSNPEQRAYKRSQESIQQRLKGRETLKLP